MQSILSSIPFGIEFLASLATVLGTIVTLVNYLLIGQHDPKDKKRQQRFLLCFGGLSILITTYMVATSFQPLGPDVEGKVLYRLFSNHFGEIRSVAWSPDSKRIATAGETTGSIQIWNARTGELIATDQPPSIMVESLSWSPDGNYIAASAGYHLYLLEVSGDILHRIPVIDSSLLSAGNSTVAWSPDSTRIAAAYDDNKVRVWRVVASHVQDKPDVVYTHHSGEVYTLAWSPDSQSLASASSDHTVQLWHVNQGDTAYLTFKEQALDPISFDENIAWSPDGEKLAMKDSKGTVIVWSIPKDGIEFSFQTGIYTPPTPHYSTSTGALAWSPDSIYLATGTFVDAQHTSKADIIIRAQWGVESRFSSDADYAPIHAIAWSPNEDYLAVATDFEADILQARGLPAIDSPFIEHLTERGYDNPWIGAEIEGTALPFGLGGMLVYASLFWNPVPRRQRAKTLWRGLVVSRLLKMDSLYFSLLLLEIFLCWIVIRTYDIPTPPMLGVMGGCVFLGIVFVPRVILLVKRDVKVARYIKRGIRSLDQKDYLKATENFDRALAWNPEYYMAYRLRGRAYAEQKKYEQAIEEYNRALAIRDRDIRSYAYRAQAYGTLKDYHHALDDYNRALELTPHDAYLYEERGNIHLWLSDRTQARIDYIRSCELAPANMAAAWRAVWVSMDNQHNNQGRADRLEEIADINPQCDVAHLCRGVALALRGKLKIGLKEVEESIRLAPEKPDAYFWKGMLFFYHYRNDVFFQEARTAVQQSQAKGLPPALLFPLYWLEQERPAVYTQYVKHLLP